MLALCTAGSKACASTSRSPRLMSISSFRHKGNGFAGGGASCRSPSKVTIRAYARFDARRQHLPDAGQPARYRRRPCRAHAEIKVRTVNILHREAQRLASTTRWISTVSEGLPAASGPLYPRHIRALAGDIIAFQRDNGTKRISRLPGSCSAKVR